MKPQYDTKTHLDLYKRNRSTNEVDAISFMEWATEIACGMSNRSFNGSNIRHIVSELTDDVRYNRKTLNQAIDEFRAVATQ